MILGNHYACTQSGEALITNPSVNLREINHHNPQIKVLLTITTSMVVSKGQEALKKKKQTQISRGLLYLITQKS
jgi:hypothetical protein